jgi:imidazolonepropionase-like amidohydrolase
MRLRTVALAALALTALVLGPAWTAPAQEPPSPEGTPVPLVPVTPGKGPVLVLTGARVLEPSGERFIDPRDIFVAGGRITVVSLPGRITPPPGAVTLDLTGLYLIPGLIDLHSHLLLHPYNETPWDDQVLRESLESRTIRAVAAARATVEAGFTTVRDLGTEGAGFADVALRDAVAAGTIPGPRIFAATRALVASGSYGPAGFDPRWEMPKGAQVVDGADGIRRGVREQVAAGADWIKVYADYRRRPGDPSTPTFSQEELAAAVEEARSAGRPVAAHANTAEGIRRAVMAGVATIEHGSGATDELLALMRQRKVALCPTLAASEAIARYAGWKGGEPEPDRVRESRQMFARALASGVTIACGSDVGVFAHGDNARELELMVAYGMKPKAALKAATVTAAEVLGKQEELGRIAQGYAADLVALSGDPMANISALRNPAAVVRNGVVVHTRGLKRTE